jgi:hypothetical protein
MLEVDSCLSKTAIYRHKLTVLELSDRKILHVIGFSVSHSTGKVIRFSELISIVVHAYGKLEDRLQPAFTLTMGDSPIEDFGANCRGAFGNQHPRSDELIFFGKFRPELAYSGIVFEMQAHKTDDDVRINDESRH